MGFHFRYIVFSGIILADIECSSLSHTSAQTIDIAPSKASVAVQQSHIHHWNQVNRRIDGVHNESHHPIFHAISSIFHKIAHTISNGIHSISNGMHKIAHTINSGVNIVSNILTGIGHLAPAGPAGARFIQDGLQLVFGNLHPPAALTPSPDVLANSAGKTPVILVQGSFGNSTSLQKYYDAFEEAGIPTYSPTLGKGNSLLGAIMPQINGTASVNTSTKELSQFIDKVQAETGAPKVDLVAYSQGGLITRNYITHDDKNNVQAVVTLGGTDHGAGLNGLTNYLYTLPKGVQNFLVKVVSAIVGPGQPDQFPGSSVVQDLNKYPDTKPGVHYLQIASKDDTVASPYQTTWLKPGPGADVTNIEVHSIPGVENQNFNHLEYPLDPAVVKATVNYIEAKGEPAPTVSASPIVPAEQTVTPPAVSILH